MNQPPQPRLNPVARFLASRRFVAIGFVAGTVALAASGAAIALLEDETSRDGARLAKAPPAAPQAATTKAAPGTSLTVNVAEPLVTQFNRAIAATGTVGARDELVIGSDIAGLRIIDVRADVGSVVQEGQLLARADDAQLLAQLSQQEALIQQALAELAQADANLERAESVLDAGVYSIEAVQTRRTAAIAARAKLDLARAQRRELDVKIRNTRILAPAAGVVSRRTVTLGAVVQNGTEMFRVIRNGQIEWQAELPHHSLVKVKPGAKVRVSAGDGDPVEGSVRLVAPTIDAQTRNGLVYVTLPVGSGLKAGGHARGEILVDDTQVIAVPEAAVLMRDGYPFVYRVGPDDVARLTRLETGSRQRGLVEVTGGLPLGARVVTTGAGFVKDGETVRVAPQAGPQLAQIGEQS